MRPSFVASFALLAAAGCSSAALGQQFNIGTFQIWSGSSYVNNYNGPSNGNYDLIGAVSDGGFDAFDDWMYHANLLGGLSLNRRVDTLSAINTYRHIDTFTNNTGGSLTVPLSVLGNLGSDGNEHFERNDAYAFISHDSFLSLNYGDPLVCFMNGNNAWAAANITRAHSYDDVHVDYTLTLAPGESVTLMYATFLARDITNRSGDIALGQATVNAMLADPLGTGLYTGLTQGEINSIVNWAVPTPGAAAVLGLGGLAALCRRRA